MINSEVKNVNLQIFLMPVFYLGLTVAIYLSPLSTYQIPNFVILHTFLEILSIALSLMVFAVFWATRNKNLNTQGAVLSFAFISIAFADTFHITSYKGMPNFFNINSVEAAIFFWVISRAIQTSVFLIIAQLENRKCKASCILLTTGLALTFPVALYYLTRQLGSMPVLFYGDNGLTNLKIAIEITFSLASIFCAYLFLYRRINSDSVVDRRILAKSCLYFAVMGLSFTLYKQPDGIMNLWGHCLKLISYAYIYQAVIYTQIISPYNSIDLIRKELIVKVQNVKLLEEELERSRKVASLGSAVRGMSHDLNNVLMIINNAANSILKINEVSNNEIVIRKVAQIRNATLKSQEFLKSLLNFSRNVSTDKQEISLIKTIHEFQHLIKPILPRNIKVSVHSKEDLNVYLKKTDLEQLLFNLVLNARDALEDRGGQISVNAFTYRMNERTDFLHYQIPEGEYVCLTVSDNGPGIPADNMKKIFEPFFTTKASGKGTGVGLPTVLSIVQKNNGYLKVESSEKGTTFFIFFLHSSVAREDSFLSVA
jgi:signal transduction histidine kinase